MPTLTKGALIALKQLNPFEPVRIMHLTWGLGAGGIQRLLTLLHTYLNPNHFHQHICCLREKGLFYSALEKEGANLCFLAKDPGIDLHALLCLARYMHKIRPHIIHAHDFTGHLWGFLALRLYRQAVLIRTYHDYLWTLSPVKKKINRWLSLMTTANIMVSEQQYGYFINEGYPIGTSWVIRNGVDLRGYQPSVPIEETRCRYQLSGKSVILGVIGRLVAHKKQDQVILACKDLLNQTHDRCLVIIGEGPEKAHLKALCQDLGLNGKVRFLDEIEVDADLLNLLDIGIFFSEGEGSPFTLLELMAAKIPIVASDVCGINEIITHEEQGLLVPKNNVPALSKAIRRLIEDDQLQYRLAFNAYEHLKERHGIQGMISALQACYIKWVSQEQH